MSKQFYAKILLWVGLSVSGIVQAQDLPAVTATISPDILLDFEFYPPEAKSFIQEALKLTTKNLTYHYGSANPVLGGMDCSGTIYYLLHQLKINTVPRQSNDQYFWVRTYGKFYPVNSRNFASRDFENMKPGDLLFWTGTYSIKRKPNITHVMIYMGIDKMGNQLMVGASDGRTFNGNKMWGVSVFDFKLPTAFSRSKFIGYSCVPGLTCD